MKELYRLKKGKGLYGNGQSQITKDDLLLVDKEEDLSNFVKTDDIAAFIKADEIANYTLSSIVNNEVSLLKDEEIVSTIDLSPYLDDTNLARILEGTVENGIATFKRSDETEFTVDFSSLIDQFTNRVIERTVVLEDYSIMKTAKEIPFEASGEVKIEVIALNEGTSAPNTVRVELRDGNNLITTRTSLTIGEVATLTLLDQ